MALGKRRSSAFVQKIRIIIICAAAAALIIGVFLLIHSGKSVSKICTMSFEKQDIVISLDQTYQLKPVFSISDESKKDTVSEKLEAASVSYKSADQKIAEVDEDGSVTPVSPGKTVITAACLGMKTEISLQVIEKADSISFSKEEYTVEMGERLQLSYLIQPSDKSYEDAVRFSVDDEDKAVVTDSGLLSALKAGDVAVTVSCGSAEDTCIVHQTAEMEELRINESELSLHRGEIRDLEAVMRPENSADPSTVVWTSSDENVVAVGQNGSLIAVGYGEADVKASCGDFEAVCEVTVDIPLKGISLLYSSVSMIDGQSFSVPLIYRPADYIGDQEAVWTSSNEAVCTVVPQTAVYDDGTIQIVGIVTARGNGAADITVTCGDYTSACTVSVGMSATGVEISETEVSMKAGQSHQLTAQVLPASADQNVTWISSDPYVVTVSDGKLTAKNAGTAVITAVYSAFSATCTVNVTGDTSETGNSGYIGRIIIGDSRTVYLNQFVSLDQNDLCIAKGAQYYTWFADEAVPSLKTILRANPNYIVIINMGVNDCANNCVGWQEYFAEDYINLINSLINEFPETKFCFASVGYCDGNYDGHISCTTLNPWVDVFNEMMKQYCSAEYIDLNEYLTETGYSTMDGVHFDRSTCQKIYDYYKANTPLN